MKEEIRCWICKRTEEEVKAWLEDHGEDIEKVKKIRHLLGIGNWNPDEVARDGLMPFACLEWMNARVPLCIICQSMLFYLGAVAADMMIEGKLIQGELMKGIGEKGGKE